MPVGSLRVVGRPVGVVPSRDDQVVAAPRETGGRGQLVLDAQVGDLLGRASGRRRFDSAAIGA